MSWDHREPATIGRELESAWGRASDARSAGDDESAQRLEAEAAELERELGHEENERERWEDEGRERGWR